MKRILICLAAFALFSGCYSMPDNLARALTIQTKATRAYINATLPAVQDEEMRGVGSLLLTNCDSIDKMVAAEKE